MHLPEHTTLMRSRKPLTMSMFNNAGKASCNGRPTPSIKVCVAYEYRGKRRELAPLDADGWDECKPVYLEFPGWDQPTSGIREWPARNLSVSTRATRTTEPVLISTGIDEAGDTGTGTIIFIVTIVVVLGLGAFVMYRARQSRANDAKGSGHDGPS